MASDTSRLSASDSSLSADLIANRGFSSARRGFDTDEVKAFLGKVAQEFRAMRQLQTSLEELLRDAEYRAVHPTWDENTLLAAVGEETVSILRSAHAAAADIKAKAEDNASRILKEAQDQSAAVRGDAEAVMRQRTDEAETAAARLLQQAMADAERMRDTARQQAESIRSQVEIERQAVVEAAQTTRERILADLSRRRKVASVQIEQLRAGRERLLEAYRVVRGTLDEVTDQLERADAEARAAADAVVERMPEGDESAGVETVGYPPEAQGSAPKDPAGEVVAAPGDQAIRATSAEARAGEGEVPRSDDDEAALQRRDEAVGSIEASLARRLKRVLQDEQNDLLDRLRSVRGQPKAAQVLPKRDVHAGRFAKAGRPLLDQAARAGAAFMNSSLGQDKAASNQLPELDDLAAELAEAIIDPLRRRLEGVFAGNTDEDANALAESLGVAYREWKTQRIELTASDHVASAFARGAFAATPSDTMLRWVVDDVDGPCPDCDDNALAGDLPRGDEFPTGQRYPPAHAGCRCLLVPKSA